MITPSWSKIFHRFQAGTTIGSMRENVFKGFQAGNLVSCSKLESKLSVSRFSKLESSKLKIGWSEIFHRFQAGTTIGSKLKNVEAI